MPDQPKTPTHSLRIPDDLWHAALTKAEREGTTVSDVVRRCLSRWVAR